MIENIPKGDIMTKMMRDEDMRKRKRELKEKNTMTEKEAMIEIVEKGITENPRPQITNVIVQATGTVAGALHGIAAEIWRENEIENDITERNIIEKNMKSDGSLRDEDMNMNIDVAFLEITGVIVAVMMLNVRRYLGHQVDRDILKTGNILEAELVRHKNPCHVRN